MKNKPSKNKTFSEELSPSKKEQRKKIVSALAEGDKKYGRMLQRLADGTASDDS